MRILSFSLIAVIFTSINVYSYAGGQTDPVLKLKENVLKHTGKTCDLCGCYMGLDLESKSQAGIRYRLRTFKNASVSEEHESSVTDHTAHTSNSSSIETYNTFEIFAKYFITRSMQLSVTIPVSSNNIEGTNYKGAGDISAIFKINVLKNPVSRNSVSKLYLGAGIKFPTGNYRLVSPGGEIEPHFQSGTGSTDLIFTGSFYASDGRLGIDADNVLKLNTTNSNNYHFANRLNTSVSFFGIINPSRSFNIIPNAGFYLETAGYDKLNDENVTDSGGTVMFLSMGSNIKISSISVGIDVQKPVFEDLNGSQSSNNLRFSISAGYIF